MGYLNRVDISWHSYELLLLLYVVFLINNYNKYEVNDADKEPFNLQLKQETSFSVEIRTCLH